MDDAYSYRASIISTIELHKAVGAYPGLSVAVTHEAVDRSLEKALEHWKLDLRGTGNVPTYFAYALSPCDEYDKYGKHISRESLDHACRLENLPIPDRETVLAFKRATDKSGGAVFLAIAQLIVNEGPDRGDDCSREEEDELTATTDYIMASGYFDRDGLFVRPSGVHTSRRELHLENIHDLDGTIMAKEGIELNSRLWLNQISKWPDSTFRWTLVIAPDRNEFIDELLETERNVPYIIEHFRRSYHEELQTNDKPPTSSLVAQTVIERAAEKIRLWKRKGRPEMCFKTAHLTLIPVIAAMFELDGEQNYWFKKAMRWLSCAPLETHLKLLCAAPDMPFELIVPQLNKTIESIPTAGKRMLALANVIHGMQLASDISSKCTTCDKGACPGPLLERHQVESHPVLRRSIVDRTFQLSRWSITKIDEVLTLEQMVDRSSFKDLIFYISTFRSDSEIYCVHKLLPLLETGISEKQDVPGILHFLYHLSSVKEWEAFPISAVKMLFTELTPLICKELDRTFVFDKLPNYTRMQEYLYTCLRLRLPDCALMFFLESTKEITTCIVQIGGTSRSIMGIRCIRFLKEIAEDIVRLDPSTKLYRACQRIIPELLNTYLDHAVGQEPEYMTNAQRQIICDRTPTCTTCSAVNAFLLDPDRVSSRYAIESGEFTHLGPSLKTLKSYESVGGRCSISYDREIWHDGLRWADVTVIKHQTESASHEKWETRVQYTEKEFENFGAVLKTFLGEAYERTVTMSRIRNRKHTRSSTPKKTTQSSSDNTISVPLISVPLLNGETILVPFRRIGTTRVPMFRGPAPVAATPSRVPEAMQPKRKRPEDPLAETDKRQKTDSDKRNPPCTPTNKSSSSRRTRAAQERRISEDDPSRPWFISPSEWVRE